MARDLADFVQDATGDKLARLSVCLQFEQALPRDLADWLLVVVLRELRYRTRNVAIARIVRTLPGRSTWNRCAHFLAMARADDPAVEPARKVGLRIPRSVDQIYRIVRTTP